MITKLSLLSRTLPDLFRRLPAVTSVGYRMPHNRYFLAGISFSAALHAAVLLGINPPPPPPPPAAEIAEKPWRELKFGAVPEEPPPPPPELAPKSKDEPKPRTAGEDCARIPEPMGRPEVSGSIFVDRPPDLGKMPTPGEIRWNVPLNPGPDAGGAIKATVYSTVDLDKVPVATNRIPPRYPFELKKDGVSGTAVLRFVVDSHGEVSEVEVLSADRPEFGRAAVEAMLRWKFRAGMKDGRRVNTRMEMPMRFTLGADT